MDKFESQFETVDVRTAYMDAAMDGYAPACFPCNILIFCHGLGIAALLEISVSHCAARRFFRKFRSGC